MTTNQTLEAEAVTSFTDNVINNLSNIAGYPIYGYYGKQQLAIHKDLLTVMIHISEHGKTGPYTIFYATKQDKNKLAQGVKLIHDMGDDGIYVYTSVYRPNSQEGSA